MQKTGFLLVLIALVAAVRRHEFKTCKDSSFCARNRYLVRNLSKTKHEGLRFSLDYEILDEYVSKEPGGIAFKIRNVHEKDPFLHGKIHMYTNGMIQVFIDEIDGAHKRFRTPKIDLLNEKVMIRIDNKFVKIENERTV